MAEEKFPINIWVNEERYQKLHEAELAHLCQEKLAGMKVIQVFATEAQKDRILKLFPTAKFDASTTRSIELLPRKVKDAIFDMVVRKKKVDVLEDFLNEYEASGGA
ncbi:hypothetical protein G3N55_12105 [Dissulfurirhabdus thermomarina]|uniref:Uncharacterized protein n=1 Tax=Dissulfurirhabdus thermomarina TaxID=1765737 RepID=A0A6N9TVX5_DISTH|nr:hypothetical protein [Dissulfurirhabdus thermomarina]NDY43577.1 hypothetical protein [Dissulfurirhabdus thermomarina]NMX23427.1 hypothetical protein [Dissulfurirhabdus thermomarina]